MGSKGSSAPAPDPRLAQAQIDSMGTQNDMLRRITANNDELLPIQKQQLQFGLDSSKSAYDQSQADRNWMLTRRTALSGIQDKQVQDAMRFNSDQEAQKRLGVADADVNDAFAASRGQNFRAMSRMGVNPSSGRAMAFGNANSIAQAGARATAANKVRDAARAEGFALTDRANNSLAGYPAMSMQATGAGAGYGGMGLSLTNTGLGGMNSGYGAAGSLAGQVGSGATNMWGAQGSYQANMDGAAGGGGLGSTMGGLGSMAGGFASLYKAFSDRRLKDNVVFVGRHPTTGLALYEFNYKADPEVRYRGVMADEVRHEYPHAVTQSPDGYLAVDYALLGVPFVEVSRGLRA